jgi:hypothetical protein
MGLLGHTRFGVPPLVAGLTVYHGPVRLLTVALWPFSVAGVASGGFDVALTAMGDASCPSSLDRRMRFSVTCLLSTRQKPGFFLA